METVKVRRVGNSNTITLPRSLEDAGFREGTQVMLVPTPSGEIMLVPEGRMREFMARIIDGVVAENREALDALAAYDRSGDSR